MAKLSTVESLRNRLGKENITPVNNALDSALESATLRLSELLRTGFARESHKDVFWVEKKDLPYPDQWVKFALAHGFVDDQSALTVTPALNIADLDTEPALDAGNVDTDFERGLVRVMSIHRYPFLTSPFTVLEDEVFVQVEYTAGFEDTDDNGVFEAVPDWLVELAEIKAAQLYACDVDDDDPEARYRVNKERIWEIAEQHIRWYPSAIRPMRS